MSDATLILAVNEIRGKTLKLLEPVSETDARFTAPGLHNSILWHAGHSLVVVEHLGIAPFTGGKMSYPPAYFDAFSWKSNPATVTTWPSLAEVREKLIEQQKKLLAILEKTDDAKLSEVIDPQKNRTLRYSVFHGLHDEAGHQGEIWLLRKMLEKK